MVGVFAYYFTAFYTVLFTFNPYEDWELKTFDTKTAKLGIEGFNFCKKAKVSFTKGYIYIIFGIVLINTSPGIHVDISQVISCEVNIIFSPALWSSNTLALIDFAIKTMSLWFSNFPMFHDCSYLTFAMSNSDKWDL